MPSVLKKFYNKNKRVIITVSAVLLIILFIMPIITTKRMKRGSAYTEKEDVALYLQQYHELPPNYITYYGLQYMKNHNKPTGGYIMGGDTHYNDGKLSGFGVHEIVNLKECDIAGEIYNIDGNRGVKRLVYTCNAEKVRVFYTQDHYSAFTELTSFQLQLTRNIFWIIFGCYAAAFAAVFIKAFIIDPVRSRQ